MNLIIVGSDEERMMEIPDNIAFLLPGADLVVSQTEADGEVKEQVVKITSVEIPATIDEPNKLYTTGTPRIYVETPLKRIAFAKLAVNREDRPPRPGRPERPGRPDQPEKPEHPNPPVTNPTKGK